MSPLRSQDTSGKLLSKCIDCIISMLAGITTLLTHYMSTLFLSLNHVLKEMYHQGMWLFLFETKNQPILKLLHFNRSLSYEESLTTFLSVKAH